MKCTWLGQAGFLFETGGGVKIMVDPYLSNRLEEVKGKAFHRQVPVDESFLRTPDILVLTHCHDDHTDIATLDILFSGKKMYVLAPESVIPTLRERYGAAAEYIMFRPGTQITLYDVLLTAYPAAHSDLCAIGFTLQADGKLIYHMGDTLYSTATAESGPKGAELLILPINGKGNNMNAVDAARMTCALAPKAVLPMHWDMFHEYGADPRMFEDAMPKSKKIRIVSAEHYRSYELLTLTD